MGARLGQAEADMPSDAPTATGDQGRLPVE
jgi:hypothetical protein